MKTTIKSLTQSKTMQTRSASFKNRTKVDRHIVLFNNVQVGMYKSEKQANYICSLIQCSTLCKPDQLEIVVRTYCLN